MMHTRTKALGITIRVKEEVADRDSFGGYPCCITCGEPAPPYNKLAFSCCHVLRRSRGGLGIETNIVTLCPRCHAEFDGGDKAKEAFIYAYMRSKYDGWKLSDQMYRK